MMNNTTIRNWEPVIGSFVHTLVKDGWKIRSVSDFEDRLVFTGDESINDITRKVKEVCTGVDESRISFRKGDLGTSKSLGVSAYIILGNEPEEIVADWGYKNDESDVEFTKSWKKFTAKWEGKKCPTKEVSH
jgi:hypothetical protein